MRTLQKLAQEAIDVMDAGNPLGLTKGFARATQEVYECLKLLGLPNDTAVMQKHPIVQLWASKMHDLAGMGFSETDAFGKAYDACRELAAAEPEPIPDPVVAAVPPGAEPVSYFAFELATRDAFDLGADTDPVLLWDRMAKDLNIIECDGVSIRRITVGVVLARSVGDALNEIRAERWQKGKGNYFGRYFVGEQD